MTFVDSNFFIYAVGREHPFKGRARDFFDHAVRSKEKLVTSAEVLQELMHVYMPVERHATLERAMQLALESTETVFPLEKEDVVGAIQLSSQFPVLTARDLVHLIVCLRNGIQKLETFDRALKTAAGKALR